VVRIRIFITGGCGFIGTNFADYFSGNGNEVVVFDSIYRKGTEKNMEWLKSKKGVTIISGDIRDEKFLSEACHGCDIIYHTAAQTAVTISVKDPRKDFEINALGTFNVLEAARKNDLPVIYCSTNKVYGDNVNKIPIKEKEKRYDFEGEEGVNESFPIDAKEHTPYGSSKLAADQYTRDYASIYGINTITNRQSCIYGPRQFGSTDQGWVVHFILSAINNKLLTIYGDGKQVRDILFIHDLAELFEKQTKKIKEFSGEVYNIGGGRENTISILELIALLEELTGRRITYKFSDWRPADQKVFYCDIKKAKKDFSWEPKTSVRDGIKKTFEWISENKKLFS